MAASSSLAVLFLLLLILVASAVVPAATAGGKYSGARMVIIRGTSTTRVGGGGAQSTKWRHGQHYYRRLEDEVAPELGGGLMLLGAGEGSISSGALDRDKPGCIKQCAAKRPGEPYTRGCTYKDRCPHG